jgi:hypothetical protein
MLWLLIIWLACLAVILDMAARALSRAGDRIPSMMAARRPSKVSAGRTTYALRSSTRLT